MNFKERYKIAEKLSKQDGYRKSIRFLDGHKFEFYSYILPDINSFIENNSFFIRGYCVIDESRESLGLEKFFNYGENQYWNDLDFDNCVITEKFDGTLIIPYELDNKIRFRTKLSVDGKYVEQAESLLTPEIENLIRFYNFNIYFELIGPLTKVVVDYEKTKLVPICVRIDGNLRPFNHYKEEFNDLNELLEYIERPNFEGFCLYDNLKNKIYKIKSNEYKRIHSIVTEFNELTAFTNILNETIDDILNLLNEPQKSYVFYLTNELNKFIKSLDFETDLDLERKDFAMKYKNTEFFDYRMSVYSKKEISFNKYLLDKFNRYEKVLNFLKSKNIKSFGEFLV